MTTGLAATTTLGFLSYQILKFNYLTNRYREVLADKTLLNDDEKLEITIQLVGLCSTAQEKFDLISMPDKNGYTALHWAAFHAHTKIVNKLIKACPKDKKNEFISMQNNDGKTALHYAANRGRRNAVEALINAFREDKIDDFISKQDKNGKTASVHY